MRTGDVVRYTTGGDSVDEGHGIRADLARFRDCFAALRVLVEDVGLQTVVSPTVSSPPLEDATPPDVEVSLEGISDEAVLERASRSGRISLVVLATLTRPLREERISDGAITSHA